MEVREKSAWHAWVMGTESTLSLGSADPWRGGFPSFVLADGMARRGRMVYWSSIVIIKPTPTQLEDTEKNIHPRFSHARGVRSIAVLLSHVSLCASSWLGIRRPNIGCRKSGTATEYGMKRSAIHFVRSYDGGCIILSSTRTRLYNLCTNVNPPFAPTDRQQAFQTNRRLDREDKIILRHDCKGRTGVIKGVSTERHLVNGG